MFCCIICFNLLFIFIVFDKKVIIKSYCINDKKIGFVYVLIYFNLLCIKKFDFK